MRNIGKLSIIVILIFFCSCAKQKLETARQMPSDITSFKALAYITAEKDGIKWASNVTVLVKAPDGLRLDAIERITDVSAILAVKGDQGRLKVLRENKNYELTNGRLRLPYVGEIDITAVEMASILTGWRSKTTPFTYTRFSGADKKKVVYEAIFNNPKHIMLRFEHPRLVIDIKYKEIWPDAKIPWELFTIK